MFTYEPTLFVEPLGYQPVEFLDIPQMAATRSDPPLSPPIIDGARPEAQSMASNHSRGHVSELVESTPGVVADEVA